MVRASALYLSLLAPLFVACRGDRPVGFLGGLSGPSSELATMGRDGARLFVEQEGRRLVSCDTRSEPARAARCVRELADSGAVVVIGPMTSVTVDSVVSQAGRSGMVVVSPTVSSHLMNGNDDLFLRVIGSNLDQADTLASLLRKRSFHHPLVLWERRNASYTEPLAHRIRERFRATAEEQFRDCGYTSSTDLSFDSLLAAHPNADAVVIAGSAMDAALLCRAAHRSVRNPQVFGSQFAMGSDLIRVGGSDAEGMILAAAAGFADSIPPRRGFQRRFGKRYGRDPSFGAAFGWEAAAVSRPGWSSRNGLEAKTRILAAPPLAPLGDSLVLDRFGDVRRRIVPHRIEHGRFRILE